MHPARMKPEISMNKVFIVGWLLLSASTTFPSSKGGASAISLSPIVVRMVDVSRAVCCLHAILTSVCIWSPIGILSCIHTYSVGVGQLSRVCWGATKFPLLIMLKRSRLGM